MKRIFFRIIGFLIAPILWMVGRWQALFGSKQGSDERLTVRGMCFALVDCYVQVSSSDEIEKLYQNLPAPYDAMPWWEARKALTHKTTKTTLAVLNRVMRNFQEIMRYPEAVMDLGAFIGNPLFDWGTIRALIHAVAQIGTPKMAFATVNVNRGNDECNVDNKAWKRAHAREKDGQGEVIMRMRYLHPEDALANPDIPSIDLIIGIFRAVPLMFPGGTLAEYVILQLECSITAWLDYYKELCQLNETETQLREYFINDQGELWINGEKYGEYETRGMWRDRRVMRISRDLEYAGPHHLMLRRGMLFETADSRFMFRYKYREIKPVTRLMQTWATLVYILLSRLRPNPNRPVPALVAYKKTTDFYKEVIAESDSRMATLSLMLNKLNPDERRAEVRRRTDLAERKDGLLKGHMQRVRRGAGRLARKLDQLALARNEQPPFECSEEIYEEVEEAAEMHDVGKINTPDFVLLKNGPLTEDEYAIMKQHTTDGRDIADEAGFSQRTCDCILCHHLWYDPKPGFENKSYPIQYTDKDGNVQTLNLRGKDIPLHVRIVTLCDVCDAILHKRAYKGDMTEAQMREIVEKYEITNGHLDPDLVPIYWLVRDEELATIEAQEAAEIRREIAEREQQLKSKNKNKDRGLRRAA